RCARPGVRAPGGGRLPWRGGHRRRRARGRDPTHRQHRDDDRRPDMTLTSLQRPMMISKIHRATVTQADLHYVGSITIDATLMEAADLLPGQQVDVVVVTNGNRLTT